MKPSSPIRIATRKSALALKQADIVKNALLHHFPELAVELVPLVTSGDQLLEHPLATSGGKGLFIKELEIALLDNRADIAVHSMKDMPAECAKGLEIAAFLERDDPRDAFVSNNYDSLSDLPKGAKVGTASPRRSAIIHHLRPDIKIVLLRGNVNTRLEKLDQGQYDAIILAVAGLSRLNLSHRIKTIFTPEECLPAIGQGIIGIECRENDNDIKKLLMPLDCFPSRQCIIAERELNKTLGGNCHSPIAGYAQSIGKTLHFRGWVMATDGSKILKSEYSDSINNPVLIGKTVGNDLKKQGADQLLNAGGLDKI